jgi:hypothetical protein
LNVGRDTLNTREDDDQTRAMDDDEEDQVIFRRVDFVFPEVELPPQQTEKRISIRNWNGKTTEINRVVGKTSTAAIRRQ